MVSLRVSVVTKLEFHNQKDTGKRVFSASPPPSPAATALSNLVVVGIAGSAFLLVNKDNRLRTLQVCLDLRWWTYLVLI